MEIFRDAFKGLGTSPSRMGFGLHPVTGNIIVPIDICTHTLDSFGDEVGPDSSLVAPLVGAEIKQTSSGASIGIIDIAETPNPAMDVNPFVILDRSSTAIPKIDQINPSIIRVGDSIVLDLSFTKISGKVSNTLSRRVIIFGGDEDR
jgi:hypothetical protein